MTPADAAKKIAAIQDVTLRAQAECRVFVVTDYRRAPNGLHAAYGRPVATPAEGAETFLGTYRGDEPKPAIGEVMDAHGFLERD